jgi:GTP-binding protein
MEPIEEVTIDVDDDYTGAVIEKLTGPRKGEMTDMRPSGTGKTRIMALVPSRGLIGYQGEFLTDTRGTGVLNRVFHSWAPHKGPIPGRRAGVLISMENGQAVAYALWNLEDRGRMFINPQAEVYEGMIIGEHSRDNDLEVNPLKGKKLTNIRASGSDEAVRLTPPVIMSLEEAIAYIDDDELVEVTPNAIRLASVSSTPMSASGKRARRARGGGTGAARRGRRDGGSKGRWFQFKNGVFSSIAKNQFRECGGNVVITWR